MPIAWSPETRELHLHNGRISYVMRVHENGTLGHLHFGAALDPARSHAPPRTDGLRRFREPRSASRSRSNTRRPAPATTGSRP